MDDRPVEGTDGKKTSGWFCSFYQQWSTLFRRQNWNDFTLIKIAGELCRYSDRWEIELALLGFQVTITRVYSSRFNEHMFDLMDGIKEELKARTGAKEVLDPYGVLDQIKNDPPKV